MTFTHTDIEERLIDFLYGELDAEARAAFDAHVTTCDACRSEVRAFEQTRAAARAVVRAPLEEPVPAAVRARVMDAARATAARGIAGHEPAPPNVAGPRTRVAERWFARLRARWALPMFATVAAIGALLLVRETIFREARRPLGEAPPADLLPQGAAPPSEIAPRAREGGDQADKAVAATGSAKPSPSPISSGHARADADRSAGAEEVGAAGGTENVRVGGGKHRRGSPVQAPKKAVEPPALAQPQQSQPRATTRGSSEGPSSSAAAAFEGEPSPGARTAEARPATREREDEDEKKPAAMPARRSVPRMLEAPSPAGAPAPAPDTAAASASASAPASSESTSAPTAALVARAEKAMAAQRWNDAAVAYRTLIQRFPGHASAPAWRRRLAAAEAAAARDDRRFATPPPPR